MLQHATCCLTYNRKYSIWSTLYYKSHASSTWLTPRCPAWVQGSYDRSTPNSTIIIQVEPRPALGHTVSTICKPRMIHVAFNNTVYSECNMYNVQCTMYMYNVQCTCKMYMLWDSSIEGRGVTPLAVAEQLEDCVPYTQLLQCTSVLMICDISQQKYI